MAYIVKADKNKGGVDCATLIRDRIEFNQIRQQQKHLEILSAVRSGDSSNKKNLNAIMFQGHPNDDTTIKGSKRLARYVLIDIDDKDEADRVIAELINNKDEYMPVYIERSANYGLHVAVPRPWGKTVLETQCEFALKLHCEIDLNNKNEMRKSFCTSDDPGDLIYVSDEFFKDTFNAEEWAREKAEMENRKPDLPDMPEKNDKHYRVWEHNWPSHGIFVRSEGLETESNVVAHEEPANAGVDRIYPTEYMGIPYADIIATYWQQNNGGKEPNEGNRNSLTFQLACDLAPICNYDQKWLEQIIPRYNDFPEDEWRATIANGVKEDRKGIRYRTRKAIEAAKKSAQFNNITGGTANRPPQMPARLTKFHKALLRCTPYVYYPTVCEAVWQSLAAHLHGVYFRFINGEIHEPHSFGLLISPMSTGKGCVNQPINYILADIRERDAISRQREAEWKRKNPTGAKKQPRPSDICIQVLMTDVTHAAFVLRLTDCNANGGKALYMRVDEVELLDQVKGNGKSGSVLSYIKLAYDCAPIGQERVGPDSVDGNAPLRWDVNASSTPANARRYFRKGVNDGVLARMNLNTIYIPEGNNDIPVYGIYDEKYAEALKPYIDRINAASGEITCPQALKLARQLDKENKARAAEYDSKAYEMLSYRANVNAYVKGMILYILHDCKWSKDIENYVRWSEQWDMWVKMRYFLDFLEEDIKAEEGSANQGPCNMIAALPQEFTYQQFMALRQQLGKSGDGHATLRKWQSRGYIEHNTDDDVYVKIGKYAKNSCDV